MRRSILDSEPESTSHMCRRAVHSSFHLDTPMAARLGRHEQIYSRICQVLPPSGTPACRARRRQSSTTTARRPPHHETMLGSQCCCVCNSGHDIETMRAVFRGQIDAGKAEVSPGRSLHGSRSRSPGPLPLSRLSYLVHVRFGGTVSDSVLTKKKFETCSPAV